MNYKYEITYVNDFNEPFYDRKISDSPCRHQDLERYYVDSYIACLKVVFDFLDAPDHEMTSDDVIGEFGAGFSEKKADEIRNYYNGRFSLMNRIKKDISSDTVKGVFRYDIPAAYNSFSLEDRDCFS